MHNVNLQRREVQIGSRKISFETGKLAKQAQWLGDRPLGRHHGAVAASRASSPRDVDFLPLTVDYREYALMRRDAFPAGSSNAKARRRKRKCSPAG